jgi:hypothetical protein
MDSIVQKALRRSNRWLLILGMISLIISVVLIALTTAPYFIAKFTGPIPISNKEIVSTQVNFVQPLYFREVVGEEMFDSGYYYETYNEDTGNVTNTDYFGVLYVGSNRFLLVRTPDPINESQTDYVGSLTTISGEIQREVIDDMMQDLGSSADGIQFLPVMLDTRDNQVMWYIGTAVIVGMLFFGLWGTFKALQRGRDPHKHPALQKLARYGDISMVLGDIESELGMASEPVGKRLYVTRNWVVSVHGNNFQATRLSDLVWLHKHSVRQRYGMTHAARFYDRHGNLMGVQGRNSQAADEMLQAVYERAPWAIAGYSNELQQAWNKERQQMIAAVDQRKAQLRAGTA